jgi:hypothetical protein
MASERFGSQQSFAEEKLRQSSIVVSQSSIRMLHYQRLPFYLHPHVAFSIRSFYAQIPPFDHHNSMI